MAFDLTIRAARTIAYCAGALVVLLVGAALVVPLFLDTPGVERELQAKLSQLVQGEIAWENLSIRLLPSPRGSLGKFTVEIPGMLSVRAEQVDAHLRLFPLLHGRAEIAAVSLEKPVVRLRIAPRSGTGPKEEPPADPVASYRSAMAAIGELLPEARLDIEGGEVELELEGIAARIRELRLRVESRAEGDSLLQADFDVRAREAEVARGTQRVRIPRVAIGGKAMAGGEEIAVSIASAQLGASRLAGGNLRYGLEERSVATSADFDLDLAQALDSIRRLLPEKASKSLARFQPVSGRAQGRAKFEMRASSWSVIVDLAKSDSSIAMEGLPAPVKVASGSVSVTGDAVKVERADVSLLDARATASATIGYGKRLRIEGAVSEASVGDEALAWIWKAAGAPPSVALKTPIRVGVRRAAWGPGEPLDVEATASVDAGPSVGVELGWTPKALDIRRAAIKDARSDATVELHLEKGLAQGRFSGSLQSETIGAALKDSKVPSGIASGDLRFRIDLARPGQGTARGRLKADSVDLAWLIGRPVVVERVEAEADGKKLVIREASVRWAEQRVALTGTLARSLDGAPIIDAQLSSPGIAVDALIPPRDSKQVEPAAKKEGDDDGLLWTRWPLPVRGRIALRAGYVQYGERKVEPVVATLALEADAAKLEVKDARLCGIDFPLAVAGTEAGLDVAVRLKAKSQQIEETARCLTERGVQMTGEFDLGAELRTASSLSTKEMPREWVRNLQGTVEAESRNGRVMQFPLILKILSVRDVAESLKKDGVNLGNAGFPYLGITVKGRFDNGHFVADESSFRSNSVGFAARGSILLSGDPPKPYDTELTVLVAPLSRLDSLVRALPLVGYVVGGTLTSWPVRVSEDIRDPKVEAVSPGAITEEFVGMFQRTLKLPEKLLPKLGPSAKP